MLYIKRVAFFVLLALCVNSVLFCAAAPVNMPTRVLVMIFLSLAYLYYHAWPTVSKAREARQRILIGGRELLIASGALFSLLVIVQVYLWFFAQTSISGFVLLWNASMGLLLTFLLALNGFIRIFSISKQLSLRLRVCLLLFWPIPALNLVLLGQACAIVNTEYKHLLHKSLRNAERQERAVCKTQYPLLMIHGIFFRDWSLFNYWGRIPKELTDNGAQIFYGNHDSSLPVEITAQALKQRIFSILEETGCERVNIIAHSKGGLEARYAISCLDMAPYVASLTTINTPHRGSSLAGDSLKRLPSPVISSVGHGYKTLFTRLGDEQCDFLGAVRELTVERCAELNALMPDRECVLYQSVGSVMGSATSAMLPLNVGYSSIWPIEGESDGLVAPASMVWGNFLGLLRPAEGRGISHGDMIDLTRKDIPGFDVCEFYVDLVSALKNRGF